MPCGLHSVYHCGCASPREYPCPTCGYYHPAGYGPAWQYGWTRSGYGYGPSATWVPPGPAPWAVPRYRPAAPPALSDEDIRKAVDDCLRADPRISPESRIVVEVSKGVVTLTGSVPDKWVKQAADDIIFPIPGVVDVQNSLQVTRPMGRASQAGSAP